MYDHIWLLDLKKEFQDQKYLIHICPEILIKSDEIDITTHFTNLKKQITKKFDGHFNSLTAQGISFEKNTRALLKS